MCCDSSLQGGNEKGVPQIEVTPEMIEAAPRELWELVGDDGLTRRAPLSEFEWIIGRCLSVAGLKMEVPSGRT